MKIMQDFQIFYHQEYGGVSRYYIELAKALNKINQPNVNISVLFNNNYYLESFSGKKKIKYRNNIIQKITKVFNYIKSYIDTISSDIVHITWNEPYLNKIAKGKLVVTIHDMVHEIFTDNINKQINNKKRAIYDSDAIIAISNNTKADILRFYPDIPENKIHVIYHGTNHLPKPQKPSYDLPKKYIIFVGNRRGYKRFDFLIDALAPLLKQNQDLYLIAAGGGPLNEIEQTRINLLGISDKIIQHYFKDNELAYLYHNAQCFVYPTAYEGFGFPILEAFDNECPVVCTNCSSLPEVGKEAALYFEKDDSLNLLNQVQKIIFDENLKNKCIAEGKRIVKQFCWEKTAKETLEVYKSLIDKNYK